MWVTNPNSEVTNRIFPVLKQDKNGRSVTGWRFVDEDSQCRHFYHLINSAPTVRQRERRLPRGGIKEMQARRDAFVELVGDDDSPYDAPEHMKSAFRDRDFELMGVYEKFLTGEDRTKTLSVVNNCVSALRAMGHTDIETELTEDHFKVHAMIDHAVGEVAELVFMDDMSAYFASGLLWLAFKDLTLAPKLVEFVLSTGVTDMRVILDRLPEIEATHPAVMAGVL